MSEHPSPHIQLFFSGEDQEAVASEFAKGYRIYIQRDFVRQGLWKRDGYKKMVEMIEDKAIRAKRAVESGTFEDDTFLDLMVYSAFATLNYRAGRIEREGGLGQ